MEATTWCQWNDRPGTHFARHEQGFSIVSADLPVEPDDGVQLDFRSFVDIVIGEGDASVHRTDPRTRSQDTGITTPVLVPNTSQQMAHQTPVIQPLFLRLIVVSASRVSDCESAGRDFPSKPRT